ncbi:MAG: hypothetical protein DWQ35_17320 [Planctomycetota bacterium]|nr:MAG: hypothetical protein DWQ35_17320 [Planctomycetota bacterium]REK28211.1 MAG: hypothetical protein DWQ42_05705 [Planctomycetota bacterium]
MSTVLHRQTLEVRHSVNTPSYSSTEWLINPDLTGMAEVPREYWKVEGDAVVEMSPGEKAAIDAERLELARSAKKKAVEDEFERAIGARYLTNQRQALIAIQTAAVAAGQRQRAAYVQQLQVWVEDGLRGRLHTAQDAVDAASDLAAVMAVELDLDEWLDADPQVTVRAALAIDE